MPIVPYISYSPRKKQQIPNKKTGIHMNARLIFLLSIINRVMRRRCRSHFEHRQERLRLVVRQN